MRLSKKEKNALFELLDVMTDRCPQVGIDRFDNDKFRKIFWDIFVKVRLELRGF